jgi:hypothetical protein
MFDPCRVSHSFSKATQWHSLVIFFLPDPAKGVAEMARVPHTLPPDLAIEWEGQGTRADVADGGRTRGRIA